MNGLELIWSRFSTPLTKQRPLAPPSPRRLAVGDTAQRGQAATKSSSSSFSIAPFPITRTTTRTRTRTRTRNSRALRRFGQILIDRAVCATTGAGQIDVAQTAESAVSRVANPLAVGSSNASKPSGTVEDENDDEDERSVHGQVTSMLVKPRCVTESWPATFV